MAEHYGSSQVTEDRCADCGRALWEYETMDCQVRGEGAHCRECFGKHLQAAFAALESKDFVPLFA